MKRKKLSRRDMASSCHEVGPEDGADPRIFFRKKSEKKTDRKARQLCGEVARTLGNVLAWELGDDFLGQLQVESVVPAPDSGRLLVTVSWPAPEGVVPPEAVLERLQRHTGRLRAEVARAVCRRRVPELAFHVAARKEVGP